MRTSTIILTALAVAIIAISAPAEAKHHYTAQRYSQPLDVAAVPAYPIEHATAYRQPRQTARHRVERQRVASRGQDRELARPERSSDGFRAGLETINTAAGIKITVADDDFATKIQGFIRDVVARGYHPHQIHCYASGGHVHNSLHYSGHACDFDQRGWGLTARPMYHVADLVAKWGLRDGAEFRDWGHIDDGPHLSRSRRIAAIKATPFYGATSLYHDDHPAHRYKHHRIRYARR